MLVLAAMSLSMTSCKKDVEAQAKEYAAQLSELMKTGDLGKADSLEKVLDEWAEGLSAEDQAKAKTILEDEMNKAIQEMFGAAISDGPIAAPADEAAEVADTVAE